MERSSRPARPSLRFRVAEGRIRAFEEEMKLPPATIIALTGLASAQAQQEAMSSGVNHYLAKPVKCQELRYLLDT